MFVFVLFTFLLPFIIYVVHVILSYYLEKTSYLLDNFNLMYDSCLFFHCHYCLHPAANEINTMSILYPEGFWYFFIIWTHQTQTIVYLLDKYL
jgi:hypothetical protein